MRNIRLALLACALTAGCAGLNPGQHAADGPSLPVVAAPPVEATAAASVPAQPAPLPGPADAVAEPAPAAKAEPNAESKAEPQAHDTKPAERRAKAGAAMQPRAKVETKSAPAVAVVPEPIKAALPAAAETRAEPTLNVAELTSGLRETHAIGALTKLALKNQMDDLLRQFRTTHQSGQKPQAAGLRQPFDALVGKVLSLLKPGDPVLARKIENSREGIWNILADPEKFKSVT